MQAESGCTKRGPFSADLTNRGTGCSVRNSGDPAHEHAPVLFGCKWLNQPLVESNKVNYCKVTISNIRGQATIPHPLHRKSPPPPAKAFLGARTAWTRSNGPSRVSGDLSPCRRQWGWEAEALGLNLSCRQETSDITIVRNREALKPPDKV